MKKSLFKSMLIQELDECATFSLFHWIGFMVCTITLSDFIFAQKLDWRLLGIIVIALFIKALFLYYNADSKVNFNQENPNQGNSNEL